MLNRRDFEKIQQKTGFNLDLVEKTYHLTRVLNEMQKIESLSKNLTLKGGTALNFLYLDIPRLSIDVDLNFTGSTEREDMKTTRPIITQLIQTMGGKLGYDIKEKDSSYIISRHNLQYTTLRNTKDHIKIEINYLDRIPIDKIRTKKFPSVFTDIPLFSVPTYSLEELTAQKIKACIERTAPRDIFDVSCLSQQNIAMTKTRKYTAVYYCLIEKDKTTDVLERIEDYDLEKIHQELRQFIRDNEQFNAEKIRKSATDFLKQMLSFTGKEQQFIDMFHKEQKIIPELLFKDKLILTHHPALIYQLELLKKKQTSAQDKKKNSVR
jgi:predicted nucleotidyltransferase component of viral defense system